MTYGTKKRINMPKRIPDIERRLKRLEEMSHPPIDWANKIEVHERSIQDLYDRLKDLENKLREII